MLGARLTLRALSAVLLTLMLAGATLSRPRNSAAQTNQFKFIAPYAIAIGKQDQVYVADPGAQRIYAKNRDSVTVIAGSGEVDRATGTVQGGYKDGAAVGARFNRPLGMAVASDGSILVADSLNHCIRRIKNGSVSTYAGSPSRPTAANGPLAQASFALPIAIAADNRGNYYIADYGVGVRLISSTGKVSTLAIPGLLPDVRAVGVARERDQTTLFVATRDVLIDYDVERNLRYNFGKLNAGDESPIGMPVSFAAMSTHEVLFADPAYRTVRYLYTRPQPTQFQISYAQSLSGSEDEDSSGAGGGSFADARAGAKFQAPTGVGVLSNGRIVVADVSARTVSELPPVERRHPASENIADLRIDPKYYRVLLISNSYAYHNVTYAQSVGAIVESELNARRSSLKLSKSIRVLSVAGAPIDTSGTVEYIDTYLANGNFDLLVWMFNVGHTAREFEYAPNLSRDPSQWEPVIARKLAQAGSTLKKAGTKYLVAYQPSAEDASWLEHNWARDVAAPNSPEDALPFAEQTRSALLLAKVDYVDLFPLVLDYEQTRFRVPLYGTADGHFSHVGNRMMGEAIARAIAERRPWSK